MRRFPLPATVAAGFMAVVLSACQGVPRDPDSEYYPVPAGSKLVLNRTLTIPPRTIRVRFQYGEQRPESSYRPVNIYEPHCSLLLRQRLDQALEIEPHTFIVSRVQRREGASLEVPVRLASAAPDPLRAAASGGNGPANITYETVLMLQSARYPQVLQLSCAHWQDPATDRHHLSINQIRDALGDTFSLELPPETNVSHK